jgi:acid phosphatase (class A)
MEMAMNFARSALPIMAIAAAASVPASSAEKATGYLAPHEFDVTSVLEPAPRPGDPRYDTDRNIFRATRKLVGSDRWQLATSDADYTVPALLHDYSCAVGVDLTPERAPKLVALMQRAGADTGGETSHAKDVFERQRPFMIDHGPVCQPTAELYDQKHGRMSYDYPSGHTTWGWTWAIVLTSIAPDRAQQILERGRAYGDSRFICGAHNESAVEAGIESASATMALVSTKPAYQTDLNAARTEITGLRNGGAPPAQGCEAEAALLRERVIPKLDTAARSARP